MTSSNPRVVAAGIAVLDCIFNVAAIPGSAEKHTANSVDWVVGGCATNAAIAMARLGAQVTLLTELGDDLAGDIILQRLQMEQLDISHISRKSSAQSPVSSIYIDSQGERQIVNFRGDCLRNTPSPATPLHSSLQQTSAPAAVLADTRWPEGALAALTLAKELQIPGILDAEAPIPTELLTLASHVACSRSGLLSLSTESELDKALWDVGARVPGWLCVTDGAAGVYALSGKQIRHVPAYPIEVVDTLGAGDVWHGAFCLGLAEGHDELASIKFASAAAALKCAQRGGGSAAPDRHSVLTFMQDQAERC